MDKRYLWSKSGARLQFIKSQGGHPLNWLFLPGGPGLGSESLCQLTKGLSLPGTLWHLDLPGDGSNVTSDNIKSFKNWPKALVEAVDTFDNVILVGHSSGGMFALDLPLLEEKLLGLVLMDSAPDTSWQIALAEMMKTTPIPELKRLDKIYRQNPNNKTLKELTITSAPYFFTSDGLKEGISLLQSLPYNYETCNWAEEHFDPHYKARWIPIKLPTLILAGSHDYMTPLTLFSNLKEFIRDNILIREIKNAGHFPWIENPKEVSTVFNEYVQILSSKLQNL